MHFQRRFYDTFKELLFIMIVTGTLVSEQRCEPAGHRLMWENFFGNSSRSNKIFLCVCVFFCFLRWDCFLDLKVNKKGCSQVTIVAALDKTLETHSGFVQALIKWVRYWKSLWFTWCCHSWLLVKQTFADSLGTPVRVCQTGMQVSAMVWGRDNPLSPLPLKLPF